MGKLSRLSLTSFLLLTVILSACTPPGPKEDPAAPPPPPKIADEDLEAEELETESQPLTGVNENYLFPTKFGRVDKNELKAATFNLNRYKNGGRLDPSEKYVVQPKGSTGNHNYDAVLTHIATTNDWELIALQEVLDEQNANGKFHAEQEDDDPRDRDFPDISGYTLLPGGVIKTWYGGKVHEHCAIYVKNNGKLAKCTTTETMAIVNSGVHWAECRVKDTGRKFQFGCAHISYGLVGPEVRALGEKIKAKRDGPPTNSKFEFILGMDANSYHQDVSRHHRVWSKTFKDLVPSATLPTFPAGTVTKVSKRDKKYGPPNSPLYQIYDWLTFNVSRALVYKPNSLRVPPVVNQLKYPSSTKAKPRKHKDFKKAWVDSFSDHMPAEAIFVIQN